MLKTLIIFQPVKVHLFWNESELVPSENLVFPMPKVEKHIHFYENELSFKTRDRLQSIAFYEKWYFQINKTSPKYIKEESSRAANHLGLVQV